MTVQPMLFHRFWIFGTQLPYDSRTIPVRYLPDFELFGVCLFCFLLLWTFQIFSWTFQDFQVAPVRFPYAANFVACRNINKTNAFSTISSRITGSWSQVIGQDSTIVLIKITFSNFLKRSPTFSNFIELSQPSQAFSNFIEPSLPSQAFCCLCWSC